MDRSRECQAHIHAARILFDRPVNEFANLRERLDRGEIALHFRAADTHHFAIDEDVFASREFGIETCAEFKQRRHPAPRHHTSLRWLQNAADDLEQRALPASVRSHQTDDFAFFHAETDVTQCPEVRVHRRAAQRIQLADSVPGSLIEPVQLRDVLNEQQAISVAA